MDNNSSATGSSFVKSLAAVLAVSLTGDFNPLFLDATVETDASLETGYSLTTYLTALSSYQGRLDRLVRLD